MEKSLLPHPNNYNIQNNTKLLFILSLVVDEMTNYDLSRLNDKEFESLAADLISKREGVNVERFKPGKDQGVDGRFFSPSNGEVIIQCKHWLKSGYTKLVTHLSKSEAAKVKVLSPSRYIFITSVELSRKNKEDIKKIFEPYILQESDILGNEDIQDLISEHPDIEQKHYKLWLASTTVLTNLLNADVIGRSNFKIEEINEFGPRYVVTSNHEKAREKLDSLGSIIITGEPGIGKTTLANHICCEYMANGFEFYFIQESVSEAEAVYRPGKNQIFYFDDFLGRNYFIALEKREDSHIINFIKRVSKDKSKRFILTSRTAVLNQGKRLSDIFSIENTDENEYQIEITSLTGLEKAQILYNHIWHGSLLEPYIDEIYKDKRYHSIIKHKNFYPRLISIITDIKKIIQIEPRHYWNHIIETLDNPSDIWKHAYERQLNTKGRWLVNLVAFNTEPISEKQLLNSFIRICHANGANECGESDFYSTAELAVKSIINRTISGYNDTAKYDVYNPGVGDYVINRLANDIDKLQNIFNSLTTVSSIHSLLNLNQNGSTKPDNHLALIQNIYKTNLTSNFFDKDINYQINFVQETMNSIKFDYDLSTYTVDWFLHILETEPFVNHVDNYLKITLYLLDSKILSPDKINWLDYFDTIFYSPCDHDDLILISELFNWHASDLPAEYTSKFKKKVFELWEDNIWDRVADSGILDEFLFDGNDGFSEASDVFKEWLQSELADYYIEFSSTEMQKIFNFFDVSDYITQSIVSESRRVISPDSHSSDSGGEVSAIDDLFERT